MSSRISDFAKRLAAALGVGRHTKVGNSEEVVLGRAKARIVHMRPKLMVANEHGELVPAHTDADGKIVLGHKWIDTVHGPMVDPSTMTVVGETHGENVITNAGRDFLHTQGYGTAGLSANGLNYIALSNDALTETTASTTLSNEITLNGLGRAIGAVAHTGGTNTTTIQKTFTATGTQQCQKAALFTAVAAGTMNHALAFTQRTLISGDTIQITFTITLG